MRDELEENPTDVDKLENEMTEKFMANIRPDVTLDGFTFDSTKVSTQFAAVEAAGMQDILDEMSKQIEAYTTK